MIQSAISDSARIVGERSNSAPYSNLGSLFVCNHFFRDKIQYTTMNYNETKIISDQKCRFVFISSDFYYIFLLI